jgi:hypothetical protein
MVIEDMKNVIGDTKIEDFPDPDDVEDLPLEIVAAVEKGRDVVVLEWLGEPPVPGRRINAKYRQFQDLNLLRLASIKK